MAKDYSNEQLSLFQEAFKKINKGGIDLYYNGKRTGTSINGLARLIDCNPQTVASALSRYQINVVKDAKVFTGRGGSQVFTLIDEVDIPKLLEAIAKGSRTSKETKTKALGILLKLAQAGFRLMVLLEVTPEKLGTKLINHIEDASKTEKVVELSNVFNFDLKTPLNTAKKDLSSKRGYIYLFEGVNVVKLGYSTNVKQRLKGLSRWKGELELVASVKGTINQEKSLHFLLHSTGEYFGDEWYPAYRKHEILKLMDVATTEERESNSIHCADHAVAIAKSVGNKTKGYIDQLLTAN